MAKNIVTLDVETKKTFDDISGEDLSDLGVSFVGTHATITDQYGSFFEQDLDKLWKEIESADLVVGFNIIGFDWPVLDGFYTGDLFSVPTLDLLDEIKLNLGHRVKLDTLAQATLGVGKSGDGLDAVRFFNQGDLKSLEKYCLQDVRVTKELFDYGVENGHVKYTDRDGKTQSVEVNWADVLVDDIPVQGSLF